MYFRSRKKLQGEVSLSDSIETDQDGNDLMLMDVVGVDDTMLSDLQDREDSVLVRRLVRECLTEREREIARLDALVKTLRTQVELLERELRSTAQRVNLFEKVKIPEARENIRVIGIYLGDQQTSAVVRGKIAKKKLQEAAR